MAKRWWDTTDLCVWFLFGTIFGAVLCLVPVLAPFALALFGFTLWRGVQIHKKFDQWGRIGKEGEADGVL